MLPQLRAEESFTEVERLGVGTGVATKQQARSIIGGWKKDLNAVRPRQRSRVKATPEQLAAAGIKFTIVPPTPKGTT